MITRRDVLLASAAAPLMAVVVDVPLTQNELRVLAMCTIPASAYRGREHEYPIADPGTELYRVVYDLESRGLVELTKTQRRDISYIALATPAGVEVLRKVGVEV